MKTIREAEQELAMKEQRVSHWELFGIVANKSELLLHDEAYTEV